MWVRFSYVATTFIISNGPAFSRVEKEDRYDFELYKKINGPES